MMDDDFNVPGALAVLFDMAKSINSLKDSDQFDQANQLATIWYPWQSHWVFFNKTQKTI